MRTITLSNGSVTQVDDEDYEWLNSYRWHLSSKGYARRNVNETPRTTICMHRQLIACAFDNQVDHINGDKLDNQKSNLRVVDRHQQARNIGMKSNNSSGFKGVNWYSKSGKWRAYITYQSKPITIGYFDNKVDAARAYDVKALELFGPTAKTNELLGNYVILEGLP